MNRIGLRNSITLKPAKQPKTVKTEVKFPRVNENCIENPIICPPAAFSLHWQFAETPRLMNSFLLAHFIIFPWKKYNSNSTSDWHFKKQKKTLHRRKRQVPYPNNSSKLQYKSGSLSGENITPEKR